VTLAVSHLNDAVLAAIVEVGTTLADFADRSLGIGYVGGTALLLFFKPRMKLDAAWPAIQSSANARGPPTGYSGSSFRALSRRGA